MKLVERPLTAAEEEFVQKGFEATSLSRNAPVYHKENISFVLEKDGEVAGTLYGHIVWDWLYVDTLFVYEAWRGQDLGTQLMDVTEGKAREKRLTGLHLTTQDWQALDFYLKRDFRIEATLKDFPRGHERLLPC